MYNANKINIIEKDYPELWKKYLKMKQVKKI